MALSVFELFSVGIGPSSSHTVGPMRAARMFVEGLRVDGMLASTATVTADLYGSLGATGHGHGSDRAVILGLSGESPELIDPRSVDAIVDRVAATGRLEILGEHSVVFVEDEHLVMHRTVALPGHPNGMIFRAKASDGSVLRECTYYSVGGGFVVDENQQGLDRVVPDTTEVPYPFRTGAELLSWCDSTGLSISEIMRANERCWRSDEAIDEGLLHIWSVMQQCVEAGSTADGTLPGGLKVRRRAAELRRRLESGGFDHDPLHVLDWVSLYAMAVNEENASGGRVVTAPTNGAAGIIPSVLHYYRRWVPGANDEGVVRFLLTAGAIAVVFKETASISGAEVGCQGEVGSACSMAAAGLTEVMGGTALQVENAAEIAMEHNLGLTCDPVGGLVQIPCIERNAVASVKAITASRTALNGDGVHVVTLDAVIRTMRQTGADMKTIYKETSRGGLAVNVIEC